MSAVLGVLFFDLVESTWWASTTLDELDVEAVGVDVADGEVICVIVMDKI